MKKALDVSFAPLFVIFAAMLWGFDGIVLRPSLYSLPVSLVVFVESSIISLFLIPILYFKRNELKKLSRNDWLAFVFVAIMGGVIGTMSITKALFYVNFVNLSIVVLIQKLQPIFAIGLAFLILKERPHQTFYLWAFLAGIGAYIMTFGLQMPNFDTGDKTVQAAFYAILAVTGFGSSTVFSKRALRNVDFKTGTALRFTFTAISMFIVVNFLGEMKNVSQITPQQIKTLLMIVLITGGPGIFMYYFGLKRITASIATICELAFPLTAIVLEYILRNNVLSAIQWAGVILLIFSILKVTYPQKYPK